MIVSLVSFLAVGILSKQGSSVKDRGYIAAKFSNNLGGVTVYLPNDIAPGDAITGSVFVDSSAKEMQNVQVLLGEVPGVPLNRTRALRKWFIPTSAKDGYPLVVRTKDGHQIGAMRIPISPDSGKLDAFTFPSFVQLGRPAVIWGLFDGDGSNTSLKSKDSSISILAESLHSVVYYVPYDTTPGPMPLALRESNQQVKADIRAIGIDMTGSTGNLEPGQKTTFLLKISGLSGLDAATVPFVRVQNLTPKILDFQGQEFHTVIPKPGPDGTYEQRFEATSLKLGGFLLTTYVEPGRGIVVVPGDK